MLIAQNGEITGAVSGGCVEKEVQRQAQAVFESGIPKIMTYDGRYRLGCEGVLYILIEPFYVSDALYLAFQEALRKREHPVITSFFKAQDSSHKHYGSCIKLKEVYGLRDELQPFAENLETFTQTLAPCFQLWIIGGEHDAVKLCQMAALLGWEVSVITSIKDPKMPVDFPGAKAVLAITPENLDTSGIDPNTAVILMTHSFAQDLQFLLQLKEVNPAYLGMLGSNKRRAQLEDQLFEYAEALSEEFLESIHSPAGLNIGAVTPEEIALSILSEILTVTRKTEPRSLKTLHTKIHQS